MYVLLSFKLLLAVKSWHIPVYAKMGKHETIREEVGKMKRSIGALSLQLSPAPEMQSFIQILFSPHLLPVLAQAKDGAAKLSILDNEICVMP
jgi:hypothetical protein